MKTLIPFAALAALFPLLPVQAQPPVQTKTVAYADLDLASADGRARLDRRLWRAAEEVCGAASDIDLAGQNDVRKCRVATAAAAREIAYATTGAVKVAALDR